jgi:hypothetical protein
MANELQNTTTNSVIIPEIWSSRFFDVLLDKLPFITSVDYSYEGEIQALGDIVNISTIPEFDQASLLPEGAAGDSEAVTITGQQLVINKRAYKDVIVTKKAQLQSLSFMDGLRDKMVFSIQKKMQADIIADIVPSASTPDHTIAYDSGTTLALADILEAKELLDTQNVDDDSRISVLSAPQFNDLFNITGFTSRDFIPAGSPLTSGAITTPVAGFTIKFTNVIGNTSYWYHPSFLTVAVQQALNVAQYDLGVDGVRGTRVNMDVLYGIKQLDNLRVVTIS